MYARVKFTIPEEGKLVLTAKIAGIVESPSGFKVATFDNGLDWWTDEGAEKFIGITGDTTGYFNLLTEEGDYRIDSIEFVSESEFTL